ncbi:PspC domain-containing protein [Enemella dayhoffiae]|nr:PspC domain-containing protein [Enemella dayhoffiae]
MELSTLRRGTTEAKVAGVCVALADRWRVDPLLVRLLAVLLALSGGVGLVLYAAAWLAVPRQGGDSAPIDGFLPEVRRLPRPVWVVGLIVASLLSSALLAGILPFGIGPAIVVGGMCYLGLQHSGRLPRGDQPSAAEAAPARPIPPAPFTESTRFTDAAAAWQRRVQEHHARAAEPSVPAGQSAVGDPGYSLEAFLAHPDPVGLYDPPAPEPAAATVVPSGRPSPAARRRGRLRTAALVLLPVAAVGVSDIWLSVPGHAYPAAALLGVGAALLVGTWRPRPRGLVALGLLLALVTLGGATHERVGGPTEQTIAYQSAAELPAGGTRTDVGALVLDLSRLQLSGDTRHEVSMDAGRLLILPPPGTTVRLEWSVDVGSAHLPDGAQEGFDLAGVTVQQGPPDAPTLTLVTHVDVGELEVRP